jgi:integrase
MRFIPLEHVARLESHLADLIHTSRRTQARDALAMSLGLQGLCASEVALSRIASLDVLGRKFVPPRIKRRRRRSLALHPSMVAALVAWYRDSDSPWLLYTRTGERVYPSHFQRFARQVTRRVLGFSYRFHALRHTFAMKVYSRSRDLLLVKKLLGHNYVTSTQIYAEALDDTPADCLVDLGGSSASSSLLLQSSSSKEAAPAVDNGAVSQQMTLWDNGLQCDLFGVQAVDTLSVDGQFRVDGGR